MNGFANKQIAWLTAMAILFYFGLQIVLPPETIVMVYNGAFLGLVVSVTASYWPMIARAYSRRDFDSVSQLSVGIVCTWAALVLMFSVNAFGLHLGVTFQALASYLAVIGSILHVTAPGTVGNRLQFNRGWLVVSALIGAAVTAVALYFQT